ncbi:hypothetical protein [Paenibacillus alvei]|uniref:hypothetical protein n=1 Tax=Paenibacillus alvei TaxID=44250 RepID=UPI00227E4E4E|nr:hypothetical protein [Paenibacillus alvei]
MPSEKLITKKEQRDRIEKEYGKSLKEVMYEMVVERNLNQWDGSEELGISKDLFVTWRTQYELGPMQRAAKKAEQHRNETIKTYKDELEDVNLKREFIYQNEFSLRGFREKIERLLEVQKQKGVISNKDATSNLSMVLQVGILEGVLDYINQYEQDNLEKKFENEMQLLEWITDK